MEARPPGPFLIALAGHCHWAKGNKRVAIFRDTRNGSTPISGAKNWRLPCLRRPAPVLRPPRLALLYAKRCATGSHNDSTPVRLPYVLSPSAQARLPTKHPALRLRGGRRTSLRFAPFPVLLRGNTQRQA